MVLEGRGGSELVSADFDLPGVLWSGWRCLGQGVHEPPQGLAGGDVTRVGVQVVQGVHRVL